MYFGTKKTGARARWSKWHIDRIILSAWMANLLLMCQATDVVRIVVAGLNFFLEEQSIMGSITHCLRIKMYEKKPIPIPVAASTTGFDAKKIALCQGPV